MNRRTLLSLIPAALITALVPLGVKAVIQTSKAWYLRYNEPYDRSLVKFTQEFGCTKATLYWEPMPGKDPWLTTAMQQTEYLDLEQVHLSLQRMIDRDRKPTYHLRFARTGS
jgi:hypothetical protein